MIFSIGCPDCVRETKQQLKMLRKWALKPAAGILLSTWKSHQKPLSQKTDVLHQGLFGTFGVELLITHTLWKREEIWSQTCPRRSVHYQNTLPADLRNTLEQSAKTVATEEGQTLATRGPFPLLAATAMGKVWDKVWPTRARFPLVAATARTKSLDLGNLFPSYI